MSETKVERGPIVNPGSDARDEWAKGCRALEALKDRVSTMSGDVTEMFSYLKVVEKRYDRTFKDNAHAHSALLKRIEETEGVIKLHLGLEEEGSLDTHPRLETRIEKIDDVLIKHCGNIVAQDRRIDELELCHAVAEQYTPASKEAMMRALVRIDELKRKVDELEAWRRWHHHIVYNGGYPQHQPCPKCGGECQSTDGDGTMTGLIYCTNADCHYMLEGHPTAEAAWAAHDEWSADEALMDRMAPDPPEDEAKHEHRCRRCEALLRTPKDSKVVLCPQCRKLTDPPEDASTDEKPWNAVDQMMLGTVGNTENVELHEDPPPPAEADAPTEDIYHETDRMPVQPDRDDGIHDEIPREGQLEPDEDGAKKTMCLECGHDTFNGDRCENPDCRTEGVAPPRPALPVARV